MLHHRQIGSLPRGKHSDTNGLRFTSNGEGGGRWSVRLRLHNRSIEAGLGRFPDVSLKAAREAAQRAKADAKMGINPASRQQPTDAPQTLPDGPSVSAVAKMYDAVHIAALSPSNQAPTRSKIKNHILPHFGDRQMASVTLLDLHFAYDEMLQTQFKTVENTIEILGSVFSFARRAGVAGVSELLVSDFRRERSYKAAKAAYESRRAEGQHSWRGADWTAYPALYASLGSDLKGLAARFMLLTAARVGTVLSLRANQAGGDVLLASAEQMKAKRAHVFPLSLEAQTVLARAVELSGATGKERIFEGITQKQLLHLQRQFDEGTVNHSTRHAVADFCEVRGYIDQVADHILSHSSGSSIRRKHYVREQNLEAVKAAYEDWASHLTASKVVKLKTG